jgi:cobalt-zinc-cadmium resistance protein CzcA
MNICFNSNSETRFVEGEISHLDLLNAKAKHHQIGISIKEIQHDLEIANEEFKTLIQYDSAFVIPFQELSQIKVINNQIDSCSTLLLMKEKNEYQNAVLRLEKNKLLPDISLGYFLGTNKYAGAKNYQGVQIGLGLPLFFGEQKARINASKIALDINQNLQSDYILKIKSKQNKLKSELAKNQESLDYFYEIGEKLSAEIIRNSEKSFLLGEIDFFQYIMSMENALAIKLDFLTSLSEYNKTVIEINYLTK